ncbi:MAG: thiamine pyrophosphate-dependent enzyme [Candidatus Methanomethylicia archaeon]|nr:thiamine pyrophosphate-dependent enzyme [Candidatus Methanomethylicia archaeon]MCX8169262.1 thiamine pyrophosphate-dependent enzyme [Candidatus Methanomethylicia archaeon]MDW7988956.1 thiamine pyrophosphate-dependent enzyme [Nitrososphaerota archaeon]
MSSNSENVESVHPIDHLLIRDRLPHIWCPGCGIGIVLNCYLRALLESGIDLKNVVVVSGIGCSGRIANYVALDSFHTTHGRAIPLAMGIKVAKPYLKVSVISGDGDIFAIGGNHFIHAARRNVDLLVICINNFNYGMTGGQLGPTTPHGAKTTTTPYGNIEIPFNLPHLAAAAGATFVARWTIVQPFALIKTIKKAFQRRGFSFIEVIAPCVTLFARYNRLGGPNEIMRHLSNNSVIKYGIDPSLADIEISGRIIVGEFIEKEKPEFISELYKLIKEQTGEDLKSIVGEG